MEEIWQILVNTKNLAIQHGKAMTDKRNINDIRLYLATYATCG